VHIRGVEGAASGGQLRCGEAQAQRGSALRRRHDQRLTGA
jgi:hypothetical protein